ncbi:MAG: shikimate dehydrogenase [Deltaproteobacteria bacterium]|nr:shikimate dehydrogenase [Deltaproteobacteria bacterium]
MINANTALFAIVGDPVSHSLSPLMHNRAFSDLDYNGVYLAFRVQDIGAAVSGIKALDIKGASVTIPHKVSIIPFLDQLDEMAEKIEAVNTVINRKGVLIGSNTDWHGAVKALSDETDLKEKNVALIGAGGAARAIGFGVKSEGGHVTVLNRSPVRGEKLAKDLDADFQPLSNFKNVKCHILINTTPLGMTPRVDDIPINREDLDASMIVMDIVYNPLRTRLLKEAAIVGCKTIDGVSMFVYQGAFQLEMWTGMKAPVEVMRRAVLKTLEEKDNFRYYDRDKTPKDKDR